MLIMRKIIHIDMDAFFASVEQRDHPEYRGKPLAVGYAGPRGVVSAASYEARRYGVRSAMASKTALRKCPQLIFVMPRFDAYKAVSMQIMDIFHEYTDLVEPLSLDEAFLDVTVNHPGIPTATQIAKEIKQKILETTGLTASAGVSYNKFLAKIASDYNKPNGLFVVKPKDAELFVEGLAIERFFGVGKVTAERMHLMGIKTGKDLKTSTKPKHRTATQLLRTQPMGQGQGLGGLGLGVPTQNWRSADAARDLPLLRGAGPARTPPGGAGPRRGDRAVPPRRSGPSRTAQPSRWPRPLAATALANAAAARRGAGQRGPHPHGGPIAAGQAPRSRRRAAERRWTAAAAPAGQPPGRSRGRGAPLRGPAGA